MANEIVIKLENDNKIKELEYEMQIGDGRAANLITDEINGFLDSLIIDTSKPVNLAVSYENIPNLYVFKSKTGSLEGQKMFVPRLLATSNDNEVFNYSQEKYSLNNRLRIEVDGVEGTSIRVIIRYTGG